MNRPIWDDLLPEPQRVDSASQGVSEGFLLPPVLRLWCSDETGRATALAAMESVERLRTKSDIPWDLCQDQSRAHVVVLSGTDCTSAHSGGYLLKVDARGITITGQDRSGIAAGLATLFQALLHCRYRFREGAEFRLPPVVIEDWPAHAWRGFMFDLARHFFPMESLYRFLDLLWLLRFSRFQLHLTDDQGWRVPLEGYPKLLELGAWRDDGTSDEKRYGGFYSRQELRELDTAASLRGITVVPEIDLPGHASAAITAYPELGCSGVAPGVETRWGIFESVLCPAKAETGRFIETVFGEMSDLFQGPYVHVGGDEVMTRAWHDCPGCRAEASRRGIEVDDLYQVLVRSMTERVLAAGKRPLVWDEASRLDLPRETIVVNWREPEFAQAALERGYQIVLAPQTRRVYLDHSHLDSPLEAGRLGTATVQESASFEPFSYLGVANSCSSQKILGGQAQLWTEGIPSHRQAEYMAVVRLAATSQGLWRGVPGTTRWDEDFQKRLEAVRQLLFSCGVNVYPGPFSG
ncbi:hexosaminidase [Alkalispirochaeta americana]|uniref:beta-N-acetylhexosaminidase n=1 Tax=Alkalispirochaeta americana TaxID=159291 RepID=A0A1N6VTY3_9SPIO|nr:beta-N-acetylhexosaminidase [Alkalispirochaeta americana]SIQ81264.1 hexosaminidase [Alkalispirochaeta americana]